MTPLTPAAVTALAQQAAEPPYDPSCVECRRAAWKDLAGTTWQCVGHVYRERNSLSAEVRRLQQQSQEMAHELTQTVKASQHFEQQRDAALAERDTARHMLTVYGCRDAAGHNEDDCPLCSAEHALLNTRESLTEARRVLWEVEWGDSGYCPLCGFSGNHSPVCALAAVLAQEEKS